MTFTPERVADEPPKKKQAPLKLQFQEIARQTIYFQPLSYNQKALWFLYRNAPESSAYHTAFVARVRSQIDVTLLQQALHALIDRHPSLRSIVSLAQSEPQQKILNSPSISFRETDATAWTDSQLHQDILAAYQHPFDLEREPGFRVHLWNCGDGDAVLLVTAHLIVCDDRSLSILLEEWQQLYCGEVEGIPAELPSQKKTYADYVCEQAQQLSGDAGERLWDYWQQQLAGELPVLELPTDRPRPPVQSDRGATYSIQLHGELTRHLKDLAACRDTSLDTILLATLQVLLHRYTRTDDILVGSILSQRRGEYDSTVGNFANSVPLRVDLAGDPSFEAVLDRVCQTVADAVAHRDYPFPLIVERLQLKRDPSRSPLFQVAFVSHSAQKWGELVELRAGNPVQWGSWQLEPYEMPQQEGQFDLTLEVVEGKDTLVCHFKYNTDLFDEATIDRLAGHFQTLLSGIVTHPQQPISQLPLLTDAERQQLLVEWNQTQTEFPRDLCIHQVFETQVDRTPDALAVAFGEQTLTYRQLNDRANQLAHYLRALGVSPETLVGICVERSLEMVVGLLGILKAGGAYLPLDPAYPIDRLAFMIADSDIKILLTQRRLATKLPKCQVCQINLDSQWDLISGNSTETPENLTTPDNLAYVIYTSGSTGKPKGVLVPHRGTCNLAQAQSRAFEVDANSRVLQVSSFSFDASISEVVMALHVGACLYLEAKDNLLPGSPLLQVFRERQITHVTLTPSALAALPKVDLPHLKSLIVAGEACSPDLVAQWGQNRLFFNAYGPTEATVCATIARCTDGSRKPPIGRPIDNVQVYILDAHLQPVPIGVPGELHVGGVGVVRGYLNRPELTQTKFISDPFSANSRLYKTGDLARYLPDGNIEFLGRIDHQVKIRGYRIELGEIEDALAQHPDVCDRIVLVREDVPGDKRLVAYIVLQRESSTTANDLCAYLKERLPDYMVPAAAAFVFLDALPLTPNGKVDRRALPVPVQQVSGNTIAPHTPVEKRLAVIWSQVLDLEQDISVNDSFFDLGGHSLLAVRLFTQIEAEFGKKLPLSVLVESSTLKQLAEILTPSAETNTRDVLVTLKASGDKTPLFLIHDADGETLLYLNLARRLDNHRPVYGLQPLATEDCSIVDTRIEAMVTRYLDRIRSVQPHGPYLLGGLCAGGVLAYEIATRLQAEGEKVAMVALLESVDVQAPRRNQAEKRLQSFSQAFNAEGQLPWYQQLNSIVRRVGNKAKNFLVYTGQSKLQAAGEKVSVMAYRYCLDKQLSLPKFLQKISVRMVYAFAETEYVPQRKFEGELVLIRATEEEINEVRGIDYTSDPLFGWDKRATQNVRVFDVPGGHSSMLREPNVRFMAEQLRAYLDAALPEELW
ncbi:MAG: amino acid adenylation domain-containing protein [Geitlerinemataceae cyanobacterium]